MARDDESIAPGAQTIGRYYRGTICKLHRGPERGRVRTANGREIPFIFQHVTMVGPKRHFTDLRDGMTVGYDVAWTSHGLRVSVIRIPDPGWDRAPLERQVRAEEDEASHHLPDEDR